MSATKNNRVTQLFIIAGVTHFYRAMGKIYDTDEHVEIAKDEMKHLALRYVHQWANLNSIRTDDDFYLDCMMYELKWSEEGKDDRQVEFTEQEKEWARKEFDVIDNFLRKRRAKYEKRIRALANCG